MSTDLDARRIAAIGQLESLRSESDIELLYMSQSIDEFGEAIGTPRVANTWPPTREWPDAACLSLWRETCDLVNSDCDDTQADGGLSAWLFSLSQRFWIPLGISAVVNDPLRVWLDVMRCPHQAEHVLTCSMNVEPNPLKAQQRDLLAISDKSQLVARLLREQHTDNERLRKSVQDDRAFLHRNPDCSESTRLEFSNSIKASSRHLREKERTWQMWTGYAEIVRHYTAALLHDELAKCRQMSARTWMRPQDANWDDLERELDLISNRFQFLPAPLSVAAPAIVSVDQKPASPETDLQLFAQRVKGIHQVLSKAVAGIRREVCNSEDWLDGWQRHGMLLRDRLDKGPPISGVILRELANANESKLLEVACIERKGITAHQTVMAVAEMIVTQLEDYRSWDSRRISEESRIEKINELRRSVADLDTDDLEKRLGMELSRLASPIPDVPNDSHDNGVAEALRDVGANKRPVDAVEWVKRFAKLIGGDGEKTLAVVNHPEFTVDQKLRALGKLDGGFKGYKSQDLADLLGVSESSIRNAPVWREWNPLKQAKASRK